MKTSVREEKNREYIRTGHSSRACPPLHAEREIDALGGRWGVHLSAADRPGGLVRGFFLGAGPSGAPPAGTPAQKNTAAQDRRQVATTDMYGPQAHPLVSVSLERAPE